MYSCGQIESGAKLALLTDLLPADSEDHGFLDSSIQVENATYPAPTNVTPYQEASHVSIGCDFYALSSNFALGTKFTWGLNLRALNETETLAQAVWLGDTWFGTRAELMSNVSLELVEIGNEPDVFGGPGYDSSWDVVNYTHTWRQYANDATHALHVDQTDGPKYLLGSFAGLGFFTMGDIFQYGILDYGQLKEQTGLGNEHQYCGGFTGFQGQPGTLMNHANVVGNLTKRTGGLLATQRSGFNYVLVGPPHKAARNTAVDAGR